MYQKQAPNRVNAAKPALLFGYAEYALRGKICAVQTRGTVRITAQNVPDARDRREVCCIEQLDCLPPTAILPHANIPNLNFET